MSKNIGFIAAVTPDSALGTVVPRTVLRWAPAGGAVDTISTCGMTCTRSLNQPGTMHVDVRVNGREVTASVQIHAEELRLEGVPDSVYPGEEVEYFASTRFGSAISGGTWQWASAPPAKGSTLTEAQCTTGNTTCVVETYEAGEMEFTGVVAGVSMSAIDSSWVKPCPSDSSTASHPVLWEPEVLKGLWDALKSDEDSVHKRKEPFMEILRRQSDSSHFVRIITDSTFATQCTTRPRRTTYLFVTWVADAHGHNNSVGDEMYGCPEGGQRFPGDSGLVTKKQRYGGSGKDTAAVRLIGQDHYVAEKDGFIFYLDPANPIPGWDNPNKWIRTFGVCVATF